MCKISVGKLGYKRHLVIEMNTKGRTGYITTEQKETLIEFMKQNPELKLGKFSASFTAKDAQNKWMTLTEELHKIPNGATKEWKQWRKVSTEINL